MSHSAKTINLYSSLHKNQNKKHIQRNNKKCLKTQQQYPSLIASSSIKKKKIDLSSQKTNKNIKTHKITSKKQKNTLSNLNLKLNRVQSQFIRPISYNSIPKSQFKTQIQSSIKLPQQNKTHAKYQTNEFLISDDYCHQQLYESSRRKQSNNFLQTKCSKQNNLNLTKKPLKSQQISNYSNLQRQKSINPNKINENKIKSTKKVAQDQQNQSKNGQKNQGKKDLKRKNKKKFDHIKISDSIKTPINKKNSLSLCSIKQYYILHKNSVSQKNSDKKNILHSTSRGTTKNTLISQSVGSRKQSTIVIKNYNSSVDLSDSNLKSSVYKHLLQRLQNTLQSYQSNLKYEISQRKTLQVQNSLLKQEIVNLIKKNN